MTSPAKPWRDGRTLTKASEGRHSSSTLVRHDSTDAKPPRSLLAAGAFFPVRLNRRAGHGAVRAKHAAIPRSRPEYRVAMLALIEPLARVRRHRFGLDVPTCRTGQRRFEDDPAHRSRPTGLEGWPASWVARVRASTAVPGVIEGEGRLTPLEIRHDRLDTQNAQYEWKSTIGSVPLTSAITGVHLPPPASWLPRRRIPPSTWWRPR